MSAYATELLAKSHINDLHREAARAARAGEAAEARPTRLGTVARLLAHLRLTHHADGSTRSMAARPAD